MVMMAMMVLMTAWVITLLRVAGLLVASMIVASMIVTGVIMFELVVGLSLTVVIMRRRHRDSTSKESTSRTRCIMVGSKSP